MFDVIPLLSVNRECTYCVPQECYVASVWYGDILILFYSKHEERLDAEYINQEACAIIQSITQRLEPNAEFVIEPDELRKRIKDTVICCYWEDFVPAVAMSYLNRVEIAIGVRS